MTVEIDPVPQPFDVRPTGASLRSGVTISGPTNAMAA